MTALVEFEHVSKRYRRGRERVNIRQAVPGRWGGRIPEARHAAIDDLSLRLDAGEALGIVGPNGAGKSTLLKLVARVTAPTAGRLTVRGRVASLIELGAGFHLDMTGRENIHFSAAILGMSRSDTLTRFDDIVEFADIGPALDTPVKRYSTGMLARLGFSVASHLESEVVTIDEVLSVGDAAFQRRCYKRIQELQRSGRAILFVTHNLAAVPLLCRRSILLDDGHVVAAGRTDDVLTEYRARGTSVPTRRSGRQGAQIDLVRTLPARVGPGDALDLELELTLFEPLPAPHVRLSLAPAGGNVPVAGISSLDAGVSLPSPGRCRLTCRIERLALQPGFYTLLATLLGEPEPGAVEDQHRLTLEVEGEPRDQATYGHVALPATWTTTGE